MAGISPETTTPALPSGNVASGAVPPHPGGRRSLREERGPLLRAMTERHMQHPKITAHGLATWVVYSPAWAKEVGDAYCDPKSLVDWLRKEWPKVCQTIIQEFREIEKDRAKSVPRTLFEIKLMDMAYVSPFDYEDVSESDSILKQNDQGA